MIAKVTVGTAVPVMNDGSLLTLKEQQGRIFFVLIVIHLAD